MKRFTYCFLCIIVSMHVLSQSEISKEKFPTLAELQRTICSEYCGEENNAYLVNAPYQTKYIKEKLYLWYEGFYLREENNKIYVYSYIQQKDLLLYDFTLQLGDSLPRLYLDWNLYNEEYGNVVDYPSMTDTDTIIVIDVSDIVLLDGQTYKKWTFDNGMEYVKHIGAYGNYYHAGDFYQLIDDIVVPCLMGIELICIAKEGKLVYLMDETKMDNLGVACLCQGFANAVEEIQVSQAGSTKVINNHQLLIQNNDKTYNVMGVEVGE